MVDGLAGVAMDLVVLHVDVAARPDKEAAQIPLRPTGELLVLDPTRRMMDVALILAVSCKLSRLSVE